MRFLSPRLIATLGLLLAALVATPVPLTADRDRRDRRDVDEVPQAYLDAVEEYQAAMEEPLFFNRTAAAEKLAQAMNEYQVPEGLAILRHRYENPESHGPADHVRYTTATMLGHYLDPSTPGFAEPLAEWLEELVAPDDTWLRFTLQRARIKAGQAEAVLEDAGDRRMNVYHRAATIEALARETRTELLAIIPEIMERRRPSEFEDRLIIEACSAALYHMKQQLMTDNYEAASRAVFQMFSRRYNRDWPRTRKLVVQRILKATLGCGRMYNEEEGWLQAFRLARAGAAGEGGEGGSVSFGGSSAEGTRFAYVIDMSGSMLAELSVEERERAEGVVTSGGGGRSGDEDEDDTPEIDWEQVKYRFDAARESLKISLRQLRTDFFFAVAFIGTRSAPLEVTPGLIPATEANVRRVIEFLDSIDPANGGLRGGTDFHGGVRTAFQFVDNEIVETNEHISPRAFEHGADAIFVLTDGAPSIDAYWGRGEPTDTGAVPMVPGPYANRNPHQINYLLPDILRMNLLRRAQVNCVGIGYGFMPLLQSVAEIGMGTATNIIAPDGQ